MREDRQTNTHRPSATTNANGREQTPIGHQFLGSGIQKYGQRHRNPLPPVSDTTNYGGRLVRSFTFYYITTLLVHTHPQHATPSYQGSRHAHSVRNVLHRGFVCLDNTTNNVPRRYVRGR